MAGHSKWSNIKRRKEAQDNKRGKIFTRLIREVMVAARAGAEMDSNAQLRLAVARAQQANMNKDNIERAILRGSGQLESSVLERIFYEGYGPGGVAFYVETLTDNRNRTVAEVRHAFSKAGGSMSSEGSVAYLFTQIGFCSVKASSEDQLLELLIEEDISRIDAVEPGVFSIFSTLQALHPVIDILNHQNIEILDHGSPWVCEPAELSLTPEHFDSNIQLMEHLECLDDVQAVYSNIAHES